MFISKLIISFLLISIFFGFSFGFVSAYSVVRRLSLLGDIMSHSALPGIVYMFFFSHTKNFIYLILGGGITSFLSTVLSFYLKKKTKMPKDSVYGLILSCFFSSGILGMALIQKKSIEGQSMINNYIFGNFVTFVSGDLSTYYFILTVVIILFFLTLKIQKALSFDNLYSISVYKNSKFFEFILLIATIFTILVGLQAIGILLMAALIIAPGAAARLISKSYNEVVFYSILIAIFSFLNGTFFSFYFPNLPTGPVIAIFPIMICILIIFFKKLKYKFLKKENLA